MIANRHLRDYCGCCLGQRMHLSNSSFFFFFFNDAAPPEFYPLPLPAALPFYGDRDRDVRAPPVAIAGVHCQTPYRMIAPVAYTFMTMASPAATRNSTDGRALQAPSRSEIGRAHV